MGASSKTQNQNKLVRIITIPVRIISKAGELYVRSITSCANTSTRVTYTKRKNGSSMPLPRSFSVTSSRSSTENRDSDYAELVRAASVRSLYGNSNELEVYVQQMINRQSSLNESSSNCLPKSASVGMGFMGRIDEDKECDSFEESGDRVRGGSLLKKKNTELYPRSRSYAASSASATTKKRVMF